MGRRHETQFPGLITVSKETSEPLNVKQMINKLKDSVAKDKSGDKIVTDVLRDDSVIDQILNDIILIIKEEPPCIDVKAPVYVCGDIHGQFSDLLRIFDKIGWPSKNKRYLFLGDYVDRGPNSLEVIVLLFLLKMQHPQSVHLLRGNHECSAVNRVYGFYDEMESRFSDSKGLGLWFAFQDVFNWMPLTAIVGGKILCMHGGISPLLKDIQQLKEMPRPIDPFDPGLATDILWSDPDERMPSEKFDVDYGPSARGISYHFSKKCLLEFCKKHSFDFIVRGHQVVQDGYEFFAFRHLVTVFSAPNYCGQFNNHGAVMHINYDLQCTLITFPPDPHAPHIKKKKVQETTIDDLDSLFDSDTGESEKAIVEEPPIKADELVPMTDAKPPKSKIRIEQVHSSVEELGPHVHTAIEQLDIRKKEEYDPSANKLSEINPQNMLRLKQMKSPTNSRRDQRTLSMEQIVAGGGCGVVSKVDLDQLKKNNSSEKTSGSTDSTKDEIEEKQGKDKQKR